MVFGMFSFLYVWVGILGCCVCWFFVSSRRRHTRCALVTGVQTCALPISLRIGKSAALAPPPLFGCACLFVNDRRDALYLSKLSLEGVQIVAVHHIGTDCLVMPLARIVAHEADGLDPLGAQLRDDAKRVDRAFCRLATCHRNRIIIEDLERDIGARGPPGAERTHAALPIGH